MFYACYNINNLDLSSIIFKNNINITHIIKNFEKVNYPNFSFFKKKNDENRNYIPKTDNLKVFKENRRKDAYKICFVGESNIGSKSSLILRLVDDMFMEDIQSTVGISFSTIKFELKNNIKITLRLWDTAGQQRYRKLNESFMKDSDCIVIGFDITTNSSFDEVKKYWYPTVKKILKTNLIYLIGNKIDIFNNVGVDLEKAKNFAIENNLRYFETSCKTGQGIDEFLEDLKNEIIKI